MAADVTLVSVPDGELDDIISGQEVMLYRTYQKLFDCEAMADCSSR